jgi:hypothetical protein
MPPEIARDEERIVERIKDRVKSLDSNLFSDSTAGAGACLLREVRELDALRAGPLQPAPPALAHRLIAPLTPTEEAL